MKTILKDIRQLHRVATNGEARKSGASMADTAIIEDAWISYENGRITGMGSMQDFGKMQSEDGVRTISCKGQMVLPGFVDSHTHLVYARARDGEYVDRIRGLSYEEIARRGGGILNSARRLREMSEDQLFEGAAARAREIIGYGTTTVEIKSGYGLTVADELKMLRVARRIAKEFPLNVRTTFLGAHAVPPEYKGRQGEYVDHVIAEMLPQVAEEGLANFIDVFCDEGFFTVEETARILAAGAKLGLRGKIHANELANSGGVQVGIAHGALSVDHLECSGPDEIAALMQSETMPTVLPGCSFFLGIPFAPARDMIDAGLAVAIATDYNPGSSPGGNMQMMMSLACNKMRLLPGEALTACTLNGAAAMGISEECGSLEVGKRADLVITNPIGSLAEIPYYYSRDDVAATICGGEIFDK